jgi:hypothetical protein
METKVFEVLAPATKSAAIAIKLAPLGGTEKRVAQSAGFGEGRLLVGTHVGNGGANTPLNCWVPPKHP